MKIVQILYVHTIQMYCIVAVQIDVYIQRCKLMFTFKQLSNMQSISHEFVINSGVPFMGNRQIE